MQKEITMESVFHAGFKAAYSYWLEGEKVGAPGESFVSEDLQKTPYYSERNAAWLAYVKELETPLAK